MNELKEIIGKGEIDDFIFVYNKIAKVVRHFDKVNSKAANLIRSHLVINANNKTLMWSSKPVKNNNNGL